MAKLVAALVLVGVTVAGSARADTACEAAYDQAMTTARTAEEVHAAEATEKACKAAAEVSRQKASCDASYPQRLAGAKEEIRAWRAWLLKIAPQSKRVLSTCGYEPRPSPDGKVEFGLENGKMVARPVMVDMPVCRGGIPKGLTAEDVGRILNFSDEASQSISAPAGCSNVDPVKLDIPRSDVEGIKGLLAWKPATK